MEDLIREMNAQLKRPQDMSADDYNLVFEAWWLCRRSLLRRSSRISRSESNSDPKSLICGNHAVNPAQT